MALREADASFPRKVYTTGPLIHNPPVLENLRARGVEILDETALDTDVVPQDADAIVIRAHGVSPQEEARLRSLGVRVSDATCPLVKKSQNMAELLSSQGFFLFLAGERRHAEIRGIQARAARYVVVENADDALSLAHVLLREDPDAQIALIAQTTISQENYAAICGAVRSVFPDVRVCDTICPATRERQDALRKLCGMVDALVIVGGRNSANTRGLLAVALEAEGGGKPAVLVEGAADIPEAFFHYNKVGISAGASTPDNIIDEIEAALYAPLHTADA